MDMISINWDGLDPSYQWAYKLSSGNWYASNERPSIVKLAGTQTWGFPKEIEVNAEITLLDITRVHGLPHAVHWKDSLTARDPDRQRVLKARALDAYDEMREAEWKAQGSRDKYLLRCGWERADFGPVVLWERMARQNNQDVHIRCSPETAFLVQNTIFEGGDL